MALKKLSAFLLNNHNMRDNTRIFTAWTHIHENINNNQQEPSRELEAHGFIEKAMLTLGQLKKETEKFMSPECVSSLTREMQHPESLKKLEDLKNITKELYAEFKKIVNSKSSQE